MINVAVFDVFYRSPDPMLKIDVVSDALAPIDHTVIAYANSLGKAALDIAAMGEENLEVPDLIVLGGRLERELDYVRNPHVVKKEEMVETRSFFGIGPPKQQNKVVRTTLLPVPLTDPFTGPMALPRSHHSLVKPNQVAAHTEWLESFLAGSGRSAYVLSHLARLLLPGDVRIVGISSYNTMEGCPVDATVERFLGKDVSRLRAAILGQEER